MASKTFYQRDDIYLHRKIKSVQGVLDLMSGPLRTYPQGTHPQDLYSSTVLSYLISLPNETNTRILLLLLHTRGSIYITWEMLYTVA